MGVDTLLDALLSPEGVDTLKKLLKESTYNISVKKEEPGGKVVIDIHIEMPPPGEKMLFLIG